MAPPPPNGLPPQGFPKSARVRKRRDYLAIQGGGRKLQTEHFMAFVAPAPAELGPGARRLGITVSRKVGIAVVRNRIKRLVREVYRQGRDRFPPGLDVVLIARRGAETLDFAAVAGELERLCTRLSRR